MMYSGDEDYGDEITSGPYDDDDWCEGCNGSAHNCTCDGEISTVDRRACEWYALCRNEAVGTVTHPILGDVPVCQRCADKHGMVMS